MKRWSAILCAVLLLLSIPAATAQQTAPEVVVQQLEEAINAGDIDAAMALFVEEPFANRIPAPMPGAPVTLHGQAELRAWQEELKADNFQIKVEPLNVRDNVVITSTLVWMDSLSEMGVGSLLANEIYIIEDGKIAGFTWILCRESQAAMEQAMMGKPANVPLGPMHENAVVEVEPVAVLVSLEEAINAGDIDAAMALFVDEPFVNRIPALAPEAPVSLHGQEQVRAWQEELKADNTRTQIVPLSVRNNVVITSTLVWSDSIGVLDVGPLLMKEIYVIEDGKIAGFTGLLCRESQAAINAALMHGSGDQ